MTCLVLQYFFQFQSCDQDCHTHWHVKERWTILCVQNVGEWRSFCSLSVFYRLLFSCFSVVVACKGTKQEDVKSSLSRWLSRLLVFGVMLMTADSEALGLMRGAYVTLWQANMGFGCKHWDLVSVYALCCLYYCRHGELLFLCQCFRDKVKRVRLTFYITFFWGGYCSDFKVNYTHFCPSSYDMFSLPELLRCFIFCILIILRVDLQSFH